MEIRKYFGLVWRWLWLIILGGAVAGVASYLVSENTTPEYRASASLLIDQAPGTANALSESLTEERLASTYKDLLGMYPVMQETVERLNLPFSADTLSNKLTITAPPENQIIIITVVDTDPERAALIANTVGEVFTEQNEARQSERFAESIQVWDTRLDEIRGELQDINIQINGYGDAETLSAELQAELSLLNTSRRETESRYTDAFNNRESLRVEEAKESTELILVEEARAPRSAFRPRTEANTVLGVAVGAFLALGLVLFVEYLDDTIKNQEHIKESTGLSTIGAIAYIKGNGKAAERLITRLKPRDPISEAYRVLRTNLSFSAIDGGLDSILVSSPSPSEGKSTTAGNLAVVLAQMGKKVIVVDADLRRPTQHKIFNVSNNQGLTTALLDSESPLEHHFQETGIQDLHVMTSGPIPPNPSELLNSQRMGQVIEALQEITDIVLFDTPPTLTVADASILAPQVNGCVLVVEAGKTRRPALEQAASVMSQTGASMLGIVLNQLKLNRSGYYGDYRYYNYEYYARRQPQRRLIKLPAWLTRS